MQALLHALRMEARTPQELDEGCRSCVVSITTDMGTELELSEITVTVTGFPLGLRVARKWMRMEQQALLATLAGMSS